MSRRSQRCQRLRGETQKDRQNPESGAASQRTEIHD